GIGLDFTDIPFVVIDNPEVSSGAYNDTIIQYANATGSYTIGGVASEAATNARGLILADDGQFLRVQRLSYSNNFIPTTNSTTQIVGSLSGTVSNVISVDYDLFSPVMGRNVSTDILFTTGNNVLTKVAIVDSGFGFANGEDVIIGSNGAVGTAV